MDIDHSDVPNSLQPAVACFGGEMQSRFVGSNVSPSSCVPPVMAMEKTLHTLKGISPWDDVIYCRSHEGSKVTFHCPSLQIVFLPNGGHQFRLRASGQRMGHLQINFLFGSVYILASPIFHRLENCCQTPKHKFPFLLWSQNASFPQFNFFICLFQSFNLSFFSKNQ